MICCRVIGTVGAQQKDASLSGKKLLLCEQKEGDRKKYFVAADLVGAGSGSSVLVSNAWVRVGEERATDWVDQWIVGIIDDEDVIQLQKEGVLR
ncbi:MAG: EutN/CcmL family microcompartment protein [Synergistaceae bacterium]|nr:EutN/CcmL family microcompartment protein [Synergistaceae bacterium]